MGWGITFKPEIYLSRQSFNSVGELKDKIEETKDMIAWCRERLLILAAASPGKLIRDEESDGLFYLHSEFTEIMETLEEHITLLTKLYMLEEYVKENPDFNLKGEI